MASRREFLAVILGAAGLPALVAAAGGQSRGASRKLATVTLVVSGMT